MMNFFRRIKTILSTEVVGEKSGIYFSKDVIFFIEKGAKIIVKGNVTFGFPLPGLHPFPSYNHSVISLKKDSKLIFHGDAFIANGTGIYLDEGSCLEFAGNNSVAHNSTILCKNHIRYGLNAASSWNFNAIDDDGHLFTNIEGVVIPRKKKPLLIGDNVAIKINVTIPKSVTIGDGAIVGACTILRSDVEPFTCVYSSSDLNIKRGVTYAHQLSKRE